MTKLTISIPEIRVTIAKILLGQATSDTHGPESKIEPGEKALGVLQNPMARSLYSYSRRLQNYTNDFVTGEFPSTVEGRRKLGEDEMNRLYITATSLRNLTVTAYGMFETLLTEEFPEAGHPNIQFEVRSGWEVVVWKGDPKPDYSQLARAMPTILFRIVEQSRTEQKA
jgi:hypothetical protein